MIFRNDEETAHEVAALRKHRKELKGSVRAVNEIVTNIRWLASCDYDEPSIARLKEAENALLTAWDLLWQTRSELGKRIKMLND